MWNCLPNEIRQFSFSFFLFDTWGWSDRFLIYRLSAGALVSPFVHKTPSAYHTEVNQKVLPVLSTETLLHIWLSTEYYGFRPSITAVDTVSKHVLDPTVPRKRVQIGLLLASIVKEVSNIVSNLLISFLSQRLTLEFM